MNEYLLVFDAGTGAGRCALFDTRGTLIASAYKEWDYIYPEDSYPNGCIFSPNEFWKTLCLLSKRVIEQSGIDVKNIAGVSTTSQREGMVFLDKKGKEIYAGPNIDNRGIDEYSRFKNQEEKIRSITGLPLFSLLGPARLLWFMKHQTDIYHKISSIMMISDWIAYRLCDVISSEYSIASSSQLLDISERQWSNEILNIFNFAPNLYPSLYAAGNLIGKISKKAAQESGLMEGTKVIAGGGDTHLGMLGIGIVDEECISAITGTSTPVMATITSPHVDPGRRVSTSCYINDGYWALESNAGMTGMSYRWVRDTFANDIVEKCKMDGSDPYEELNKLASTISPGSDGWKAYLGAFQAGINHGKVGGFFFPLTWILGDKYNRNHLIRSALETTVFAIRANYEQLKEITKINQAVFRIGGGQTNSRLFNIIVTNTLNVPIAVYSVKETTSLGCAICAAKGSGIYSSLTEAAREMVHIDYMVHPEPDQFHLYDNAYKKWLEFGKYISKFRFKEN